MKFLSLAALVLAACSGSIEPTEPVASRCDPLWAHCVDSGLKVGCEGNGAESLCTCQGVLDGHLVAMRCYQ